jgi:hypothetical protein
VGQRFAGAAERDVRFRRSPIVSGVSCSSPATASAATLLSRVRIGERGLGLKTLAALPDVDRRLDEQRCARLCLNYVPGGATLLEACAASCPRRGGYAASGLVDGPVLAERRAGTRNHGR